MKHRLESIKARFKQIRPLVFREIHSHERELRHSLMTRLGHAETSLDVAENLADTLEERAELLDHAEHALVDLEDFLENPPNQVPQKVRVSTFFHQFVNEFHRHSEVPSSGVVFRAEPDVRNAHAFVFPRGIRSALNTLINNAHRAHLERGRRVPVLVHVALEDGHAVFRVRDWGPGVPKRVRSKLFLEKHSEHVNVGGHGLGLWELRHTIEHKLGGRVFFQSTLGVGSTFGFKLPLADSLRHT